MTQSENENDHFDLDHFDHILGKSMSFPDFFGGTYFRPYNLIVV